MDDDTIVEAAEKVLACLDQPRAWMTARCLARRIRKLDREDAGLTELAGLSQVRLFDALVNHAGRGRCNRKIRNCRSPSYRTLEDLWGAVDKVGESNIPPPMLTHWADGGQPPNPEMLAASGQPEAGEEAGDEVSLFMSYNHCDEEAAYQIASTLEKKGHSIWIAGARIAIDEFISQSVREGIKNARGLLLYLSAQSLRSLWVAKEQIVGEALSLEEPLAIIVKGDDPDLMMLVRYWLDPATLGNEGPQPGISLEQTISYPVASDFRDLLEKEVRRADSKIYLYPEAGLVDNKHFFSLSSFPVFCHYPS